MKQACFLIPPLHSLRQIHPARLEFDSAEVLKGARSGTQLGGIPMMLRSIEGDRVRANTAPEVNRRIDERIERSIRHYAGQTKQEISRRIQELEQEWDIERVLETLASSFSLSGIVLGSTVDKRWFLFSTAVLSFLLLHAVQGWCPPVPLLRRLGIRTREEIDRERYALKILAGDFATASQDVAGVERILAAVK
jgi:hypothetical protein